MTTEDQGWRSSKRNPLEKHENTAGKLVWKKANERAVPKTGNEEELENDRDHEGTSVFSLHTAMPPLPLWRGLGGDVMTGCMAVNVVEYLNFLLSQRNYVALGPS